MEDVLQSSGHYWITLGKEIERNDVDEKIKWAIKFDEARILIRMSISNDLGFHLQGIDDLETTWEKLETVFGKHNEIRGHKLENELITLNLGDLSCI